MPKQQPDKPEWPTSTQYEYGPRLKALATWVQDELHNEWGPDFDTPGPLRISEKAVLLAAFDKQPGEEDRWRGVAAMLRSGKASLAFQAVVADLMDNGGFHGPAVIDSSETWAIFYEKRQIDKILKRGYPEHTETKVVRMATDIAAILRYPATPEVSDLVLVDRNKEPVQRAVKLRRDKREERGKLSFIRWRVEVAMTTRD